MREPVNGRNFGSKDYIYQIIAKHDLATLRSLSKFYYQTNGIYERVCNYFAFLYRYDWYIAADAWDLEESKKKKMLKEFKRILKFLDKSYIKKFCGDVALEVIICGAYYGYIIPCATGLTVQQLPTGYCRTKYWQGSSPVIEFNMKYFDTFRDTEYRMKILNMFPEEFKKGYMLYKQNKLNNLGEKSGENSWYVLNPDNTMKFNLNGSDAPTFINSIPAIIDLEEAQDLDRKKQMQKLLKILIQKLPMDKNGDLIFDIDEAKDIHNNAVAMLRDTVGVSVLTTFADIDSVDTSDKNSTTSKDDLEKVERALYNAFGVSQNLFNTEGNLSLEKSILNDESSLRSLLLQFSMFFDKVVQALNINKKDYGFNFYMLETTQYNYKELSKLFKEQTQMGFSKMLPQIALGMSQSFILNSIKFENDILCLSEIMIPPLMSSTLNGEDVLGRSNKNKNGDSQNKTEEKNAGRPEKPEDQKSEKTIQNLESIG